MHGVSKESGTALLQQKKNTLAELERAVKQQGTYRKSGKRVSAGIADSKWCHVFASFLQSRRTCGIVDLYFSGSLGY